MPRRYSVHKHKMLSAMIAGLFISSTTWADIPVFINEFHYDNSGTDAGEAIEIAGPAGTDLSGWSIVLYNGANGSVYSTTSLTGMIVDSGNGYGVITRNYNVNGIQNGSPDAIALVDNFNNLVQFLSYEGVVTAVDGPALGLSSTDIGVSESSSTAAGDSLQLSGSGIYAEHFSWSSPSPSSFGLINPNQQFGDPGTGPDTQIVINELDADNPGTDAAEFIELYDGARGNTSLDGLVLVLYNGSNDSVYRSFDLSGYSTNSNGYFVLCGDAANVVGCDLDVSPDSNLIQNGADAAALFVGDINNFASGAPLTTDNLVDAVVYGTNDADDAELLALLNAGQPQLNDSPDESLQRCPNGSGGMRNTDGFAAFPATPGADNLCEQPAVEVRIHQLQGNGAASPTQGERVIVDAIVVGDFQDRAQLSGFYLQEEDDQVDNDMQTSEGVFVYAPGAIDVQPGDRVRVSGRVSEYSGLTEITQVESIEILASYQSVTPVSLQFPLAAIDQLEAYEGMAVSMSQPLVISEYYNYDRYGELVLALPLPGEDRPYQPTAVVAPGADAVARQTENSLRRITLDDGSTASNPASLRHPNGQPFSLQNRFRGGDTVSDVHGVLDHRFGAYRIQPTAGASHVAGNPRETLSPMVYGDIKVASFNVLNYFTTLDLGNNICGPAQNMGCRGADNAEEFQRQKDKVVAALLNIDADVVGLIELENTSNAAIEDLVGALNAQQGDGSYAFVDTGTIGGDAIRVALIYRPARVMPIGVFSILDSSVDARFIDDRNRPVLAQSFMSLSNAARFTVAVNHLKSKGSACADLGDPDTGDGQGNCNLTRLAAAQAEMDWLASNPTGQGDGDVLIIGDLNSYTMEDPIRAIEAGADDIAGNDDDFINLIARDQGTAAYSYVFDGQFGYLDYALASPSLSSQVSGVAEWHLNADEADVLDYNTDYKPAEQIALYENDAFRSSDHDPVLIGLALDASIEDLLVYMNIAIDQDQLDGVGHRAEHKLRLFTRFMERARSLETRGKSRAACITLKLAQRMADSGRVIEGDGVSILSGMMADYLANHCSTHRH